MFADGVVRSAVAEAHQALPVCVYGTLRPGQRAYERILDDEAGIRTLPARITGHRLMVTPEDVAPFGGHAMVVPEPGCFVLADLLVFHPGRAAAVVNRLDEYEFEGLAPDDPHCPYRRQVMVVSVLAPTAAGRRWEKVSAWVYVPGLVLTSMPGVRPVPAGDWFCYASPAAARPVNTGGRCGSGQSVTALSGR